MNPDTNKFEPLSPKMVQRQLGDHFKRHYEEQIKQLEESLVRPDGTPVPKHWSTFTVGENYVINNYTFKCAYIGETSILFEPVAVPVIGDDFK